MSPPVIVGIVVGLLLVVAAMVLAVTRRRLPMASEQVDPLFIVGISVCGASAALIATLGPPVIGMTVMGIAFIGVGARRMRRGHH